MTYPTAYRSGRGKEERLGFQMPFLPPLVLPAPLETTPSEASPRTRVPLPERTRPSRRYDEQIRERRERIDRARDRLDRTRREEERLRRIRERRRQSVSRASRSTRIVGPALRKLGWAGLAAAAYLDREQLGRELGILPLTVGTVADPDPDVWVKTGDCGVSGGLGFVWRYGQVDYNPCTVDGSGNFGGACGALPSSGSTQVGPDFGACVHHAGVFTLAEWMITQEVGPNDLAKGVRSRSYSLKSGVASQPFVPTVSPGVWVQPAVVPSLDPMDLPIKQPVIKPDPAPSENPFVERGHGTTLRARVDASDAPMLALQPGPQPRPLPGVTIDVPVGNPTVTGPPTVTQTTPPRVDDWPRPPSRRKKERKVHLLITGIPAGILNLATEGLDLVDSLYWALPSDCRPKGRRALYQEKMGALWRCWDQVNVEQALSNVVNNAIEDWFYGRVLGKTVARANRAAGLSTGFEWGGAIDERARGEEFGEFYEAETGERWEAPSVPLPEIDLEDDEGRTVVSWGGYEFGL